MLIKDAGPRNITVWMLLLFVRLVFLTPGDAQVAETCSFGKYVGFSMDVKSNFSGKTVVQGRIEQHTVDTLWNLAVEFGATMCTGANRPKSKILYFTLTDTAPRKLLPPGYRWHPGVGHLQASARPLSWAAARTTCEAEGGHLATASSRAEADVLWGEIKQLTLPSNILAVWYGASDIAQEGNFVTVTGVPLNSSGFASFQELTPNGGKAENCLMLTQQTGLLDDGICNWLLGYICKIPLEEEATAHN